MNFPVPNSKRPTRLLLALHTYGQSYMHVPALLGRAGFPIDAVFTPNHPLRQVHGIEQAFVANPAKWATEIEKLLLSGKYSLLLNVDEPGLLALYRHTWNPEAVKFLPFAPDSAVAATVGSKKVFHEWCLKNDLPIPETHFCSSFEEAQALLHRLSGNWFVKWDGGSGGQDILQCSSDDQLDAGFSAKSGDWLVQRDEGKHVGSGIFFAEHGHLHAWMGVKGTVCLNDGFGPIVLGRGEVSADLGDLCRRVAEVSAVTGVTGFDFVRTPDRGPLLIDSHLGRMVPTQHFDRLYGVDFGASLRAYLEGKDRPVAAPVQGPSFIKFPEILQLAIQGGLGSLLSKGGISAKMPMAPPGDPMIGLHSACRVIISQSRVTLGRWKRQIFPEKSVA